MTTKTMTITCPYWCTSSPAEHGADLESGRGLQHDGPPIGNASFSAGQLGDDAPRAYLHAREGEMTAEECRQLAADCLSAAEWLEAHR